MKTLRTLIGVALLATLSGCVAPPAAKDYTEFRRSNPRSILVLPPINESTEMNASYSVLTTATSPLAELGYYVVPVQIVDDFLKENGLTVPGEMHGAPLGKLREVFGADAVLYLTVKQYGSKYQVFASNVYVQLQARLVDARTGAELWKGDALATSQGQSGLIEALVTQVINKLFDQAHMVAAMANAQLLLPAGQGLPKGPRHPEYGRSG